MPGESLRLEDFRGFEEPMEVDTSEGKRHWLLVGRNGSQIKLSQSSYQLLRYVHQGGRLSDLAETLSRQTGRAVTCEELEQAYEKLSQRLTAIDDKAGRNELPWMFWLRLKLLPQNIVVRLSRILSVAFAPTAVVPLLLLALAGLAFALFSGHQVRLVEGAFFPAYGLFLVSLLFHELGHSSACARYGAEPRDIGFALYLVYPAFYSDVSPAWMLKRWQRVVVDLGGAYFQFVVLALYVIAFLVTGSEVFWLAILMNLASAVFMLNPIFKFDGYWVAADALGVTNLGQQPRRILQHFYYRALGKPTDPLPWPGWITLCLSLYSIASFVFWAYFLTRLIPLFGSRLVALPAQLVALARELGAPPHLPQWASARALAVSLFFLLLGGMVLWQLLGRPSYRWVRKRRVRETQAGTGEPDAVGVHLQRY